MKLNIIDDNGFIALVNNANYKSFVDEDWQLDQLMKHFIDQMNAKNLVIWQASNDGGGEWILSFQEKPSDIFAFREFEQVINVTTGELFLTNYSDLTMAAQFPDVSIPTKHNLDLRISLGNGLYKLTIRQLFDPDNYQDYFDLESEDNTSFEVIITPATNFVQQQIDKLYWFDN